ncbi:hypothetical protein VU10_05155, partial [Desulfobulbus sp. US1]|nr:hypothetical protein [Desulfobulbus sp. US1]
TGHENTVFCQLVTVCYGLTVFIGYGLRPRNWTSPYTILSEMQNKTHLQTRGLFNDLYQENGNPYPVSGNDLVCQCLGTTTK